jgi:hypothetical protein
MEARFNIGKNQFSEHETVVCEFGGLRASTFVYPTGVHALRLTSPQGSIVVLPYQGQQIWDAVFGGRRLTMKSFFSVPVRSGNLLDSYGAFLYHCGALRMGTPGPDDDHPIHGELPAAEYGGAWLCLGDEGGARCLGISGSFDHAKAFGDHYRAVPLVKLYEDHGVLDVSMKIENRAHLPMDLMYMCHVNFLPAANGQIIQATGWGTEDMVLRSQIPSHVKPTPRYLAFLEELKKNPGATRVLRPQDEYYPEIVFYLRNLRRGPGGMTHMIQKHPDGSSDYISWNPVELDHAVRWILIHQDQQVAGMALPSTCDPEGYSSEKKKGNVRSLQPQESVTFSVRTGYLDGPRTEEMERRIRSL